MELFFLATQIHAATLRRKYETAKHLLDSALSDMDDYDRIDANEQGFFNDYNFVLNKLGEK